jgi:hypothetical protein
MFPRKDAKVSPRRQEYVASFVFSLCDFARDKSLNSDRNVKVSDTTEAKYQHKSPLHKKYLNASADPERKVLRIECRLLFLPVPEANLFLILRSLLQSRKSKLKRRAKEKESEDFS